MEENDRLQKQVSQLVYENGYFRQQTQNVKKCSFFSFPIFFLSYDFKISAVMCSLVAGKSWEHWRIQISYLKFSTNFETQENSNLYAIHTTNFFSDFEKLENRET